MNEKQKQTIQQHKGYTVKIQDNSHILGYYFEIKVYS